MTEKAIPGIITTEMSNEEYHSLPSYSSSQVKYACKNMEMFKRSVIDKAVKQQGSSAFRIGTLFHELMLEPEIFNPCVFPGSKVDKRTKAYKAFMEEHPEANDDNTLTEFELVNLKTMRDSLLSHPDCPDFNKTQNEVSMFYNYKGLDLRTRPDAWDHDNGIIYDIKTTSHAIGKWDFMNQVKRYSYDLSAAMYAHNAMAHTDIKFGFTFVVVQTVEPYSAAIYHCGKSLLQQGWEKYSKGIDNIIQSKETGIYRFQDKAETLDFY